VTDEHGLGYFGGLAGLGWAVRGGGLAVLNGDRCGAFRRFFGLDGWRYGGFSQVGAVAGDRKHDVVAQVVDEMPPVGDLDRVGRAVPRAFGVGTGPVSADDLDARMPAQPVGDGGGLPVGQEVDAYRCPRRSRRCRRSVPGAARNRQCPTAPPC